ncbi:RagB/SusD family nutrient uptake outer membrane protein [Salegentibacter sp. HM20]
MKKYKLIFSFLLSGLAFTGCEDELSIEPRQSVSNEIALSTGENIENILIGAYAELVETPNYGGYLPLLSDLYGFTDQASWVGTFQQPRQVFTKNILVDNSFVANFWLNSYDAINQTNLVIDNIDIVDEDRQNTVAGEAHFLRALSYFDLVRLFGEQYEPGGNNSQLGVPITLTGLTDYSGDLRIPRNTVEEVYSQVISDLNQAYDLLPESNSFWADKYAAQALLARVYLQMGEYGQARDAANDVIQNSGHSLTGSFADAFNRDFDSSEDIFSFQVTTQSGENWLVVHYAQQSFGGRGGDVVVEDAYVDKFDSETDDRASFFYESAQSGERLTSKYTNQFGNIPTLRLAEMYLIRAEANLREGTEVGQSPTADVNTIRERANAEPLASVSFEDIWLERELELMFEGHLIHDHKRTDRAVGELPADSGLLIYPIPQREMDVNDLLVQNSAYQN